MTRFPDGMTKMTVDWIISVTRARANGWNGKNCQKCHSHSDAPAQFFCAVGLPFPTPANAGHRYVISRHERTSGRNSLDFDGFSANRVRSMSNIEGRNLSAATAAVVVDSPRSRSRMSNGSCSLLPGIDGRSERARRYRDLAMAFSDELGGEAAMSEADKAAVRLAAGLTVLSEDMAARIVRGETVDQEQVVRIGNSVSRALATLRRQRAKRAPAAGPDLATYLAERAGAS